MLYIVSYFVSLTILLVLCTYVVIGSLTHIHIMLTLPLLKLSSPFFSYTFREQFSSSNRHTVAANILWLDFQLLFSFSTLYLSTALLHVVYVHIQFVWKRDDATQQVVVAPLKKVYEQGKEFEVGLVSSSLSFMVREYK